MHRRKTRNAELSLVEPQTARIAPAAAISETNGELAAILRNEDFDARDRFLFWYLTPASQREPKTQCELAKVLGVHFATLSSWKRDPEFCELIPDGARRRAMSHASDVFDALTKKAVEGNLLAIELFLKYALRLSEPVDGGARSVTDNRTVILIGGKPAESLPVGLLRDK